MVLKPNHWETPKKCNHIKAQIDVKQIDLPCMRDECPVCGWVEPRHNGVNSKTNKFSYEIGKCSFEQTKK